MALDDQDLIAVIAIVGLIVAVMVFNALRSRRAGPAAAEDGPTVDPFLCKFAHHEGRVVGETVAMNDGQLILKQAGQFKAVPLTQAKDLGDEVLLEGAIDWDAALEAGAAWHANNTKGADAAVSEQLTTSEDVKAPALEAFQARMADEEE